MEIRRRVRRAQCLHVQALAHGYPNYGIMMTASAIAFVLSISASESRRGPLAAQEEVCRY